MVCFRGEPHNAACLPFPFAVPHEAHTWAIIDTFTLAWSKLEHAGAGNRPSREARVGNTIKIEIALSTVMFVQRRLTVSIFIQPLLWTRNT